MSIGRAKLGINDFSLPPINPERGSIGVWHDPAALALDYTTWRDAVLAVSRGILVREEYAGAVTFPAGTTANSSALDVEAQREEVWLVKMNALITTPAGGTKYAEYQIPCAILSSALFLTGRYMDITTALSAGLALKDATEAFVKSREGFDVVVYEIVHEGRNT